MKRIIIKVTGNSSNSNEFWEDIRFVVLWLGEVKNIRYSQSVNIDFIDNDDPKNKLTSSEF